MVAVNNTNVRITIPYVKARFLLYTCIFVCIFFIVFVSQVVERNHTLHDPDVALLRHHTSRSKSEVRTPKPIGAANDGGGSFSHRQQQSTGELVSTPHHPEQLQHKRPQQRLEQQEQGTEERQLLDPQIQQLHQQHQEQKQQEVQQQQQKQQAKQLTQDEIKNLKGDALSLTSESVLLVIISNRKSGIIPTVGSILATSSKPVEVVLIGVHEINEQVCDHFGDRLHHFTSLSVQNVTDDLLKQGYKPIWTWDTWHISVNNPAWRNENTLHVGHWDDLDTHAHELNHIRFYLPLMEFFRAKKYFYFLDDDILVRKDLGVLAAKTMADLDSSKGLVCPCNIWTWNSDCFRFDFQSQQEYILDMPSLYGDRKVCKTESESHCVPENYWDFVERVMPAGGKKQHAWNFGFSLFALDNWRSLKLTDRYEAVMKESYRLHVFPETSLTFGLGVSYIAFAGAVQCWNEDNVKVRDGFGFIEWERFEKTFGKNFFENQVDSAHYTGPDKPWVHESRIEHQAVQPWLDMMARENLALPGQLPELPTENLFTVIASEFTGVAYLMRKLDSHPKVCASGELDKPETGLPVDSLNPDGLEWLPTCATKKGCTLKFVNQSVLELASSMGDDGVTPLRCAASYDPVAKDDQLMHHLPRLCNFLKQLDGNYNGSNVARLWVDAFVTEDKTLIGCGCTPGVQAKGLKVAPEWIVSSTSRLSRSTPPLNLNATRVHGSKVVRLKRRNIWARYKSFLQAEATSIFYTASTAEKKSQLDALKSIGNLTIDVHRLEWHMVHFEAMESAGDAWARDHASDVLWIDFDDCIKATASCFERIYDFIGVDKSSASGKKVDPYAAMVAAFGDADTSMDYITNDVEVLEKMGTLGLDHFISKSIYTPIQLLLYQNDEMRVNTRQYFGINATVFVGEPLAKGSGSKFSSAITLLKDMPPDTIVVLTDENDGWVNFPLGDADILVAALAGFRTWLEKLTREYPGAVVVSAQTHCCASALTHIAPGDLFDDEGKRKGRSCLSGKLDCEWKDGKNALSWQKFMTELAEKRSGGTSGRNFLDAGFLVGKAGNLLNVLETADIGDTEDDRAVLTDLMYRNPGMIVLDYDQSIMGEPSVRASQNTCFAETNGTSTTVDRRRQERFSINPASLFMRNPRSLGCDFSGQSQFPSYPIWDKRGIPLATVIDHIERVTARKEIVVLLPKYGRTGRSLDYMQGPEVPYIVDDKGIWTSRLIRDRTDSLTFSWRLQPTEALTLRAHKMLMGELVGSVRWPALTRAVRTGGVPYWSWYGDFKSCNFHNRDEESIPIFTTCAKVSCDHAFPMPNYMIELNTQVSEENWRGFFKENDDKYPWATKIRKVVWRGALSEEDKDNPAVVFNHIRWKVAKFVHELNSDLYDVGLTGIPSWLTDKISFDLTAIGGFRKGLQPQTAFQRYAAIMDMDGNSWSSRFGTLLCYNSVTVKVQPSYVDYFYDELKPWVHFVPVKDDLSDLHENVSWALDVENEAAVKTIIAAANEWCSRRILPDELARDMLDIWESYVRRLDHADTNWQEKWKQKRDQISSNSSDFDIIQLH